MTVNNLFFTAVHAAWLLFLLIVLYKIMRDRSMEKIFYKRLKTIKKFFAHGSDVDIRAESRESVIKLLQDAYYLEYACSCYLEEKEFYSGMQLEVYESLLRQATYAYFSSSKKRSVFEICMALAAEKSCGFSIRRKRVSDYTRTCALTEYWEREREAKRI